MRNKSTGLVPRTLLLLFFFFSAAAVNDKITAARPLRQGQTIVSAGEVFQLGFFSPGDADDGANNTYLGIRYRNIPYPQAVWVANRDSPVKGSNAVLKIAGDGNIVISDGESENAVWSSNRSSKGIANPVAQLLDSGNLVIRDADSSSSLFLWQSFEHPTDTLLPGMKLGRDLRTGVDWFIRSWKSPTEPGSGRYSFKMNAAGDPEFFLSQDDTQTIYRSGPWDGVGFSGVPEMKPTPFIDFTFEVTPEVVYYSFNLLQDSAVLSRLLVNSSGSLQRFTWIEDKKQWAVFWYAPKDQCDNYIECGAYGLCDTNASPVCECLRGFRPRNPQAWSLRDGSSGCVRVTQLACRGDGFWPLKGVKLPDTSRAMLDKKMNLQQCEAACRVNCSCTAYANAYVAPGGGTGCVIWTGELADIRQYADGAGQVVYVRLAASDMDNISGGSSRKLKISLAAGAGTFTLLICLALVLWKRKRVVNMCKGTPGRKGPLEKSQDYLLTKVGLSSKRDISDDSKSQEFELPLFDLNAIVLATNNFSEANKLGQGGFGTVYKGMLTEGQEIAVKRLSQTSGQGIEEFKNEVRLIARLQHRNLVRLLGCCVEMAEKILIYEFMPNNSLDSFIFDTSKNSSLNWRRRFSIICGIARGLLYLHQDSRFRVIHRDLKASNILLDAQMIPKISDFGMARIFGGDQLEANTCRVVGTYGYMSPEYAMDGHFSVKSDVFSFGVLVLEIITGKKNRGFYYSNAEHNLLGYAWGLWREGKGVELIDPSIGASYSVNEVLRCLQVGLVCVQERAEDRPTMATVVLMLSSENTILPEPRHPGFCMGRNPPETSTSSSKRDDSSHTINQVTVSVIDPR